MIMSIFSKFFKVSSLEKDLTRFAEIEYKKESPEYILHLLKTDQLYKN
jgi:hypothetical protein